MLRKRMLDVMGDVNKVACEREELTHLIGISLLSKNNLFILGDTGQAKSFVVNQFRKRIKGAVQFEKLMSKQTDEEQLFGRLDLSSIIPGNASSARLMENSKYREIKNELKNFLEKADVLTEDDYRYVGQQSEKLSLLRHAISECGQGKPEMITAGKIPECHVAFLDEIFKANEGILNSLLTALNERTWTNEGQVINMPVISFFSASNEIPNFNNPEEKILKPLYDRFQLKVLTNYVADRNNRLNMLASMQSAAGISVGSEITLDELYEMQNEVSRVKIPDRINGLMDTILCELRRKNIAVSDRKFFNYGIIVQAEAWLDGKDTVGENHMMVLVNYLWNTPQEIEIVASTIEALSQNPISAELDEITASLLESYEQFTESGSGGDPGAKLKSFGKFRAELLTLYEKTQDLASMSADNQTSLDVINQTVEKLEKYSEKSSADAGFTYVKLSELAKLK